MGTRKVIFYAVALVLLSNICGVGDAESSAGLEISVGTEDRRNQFGEFIGVIRFSANDTGHEWGLSSSLLGDGRDETIPNLLPVSVEWRRGSVEIVLGQSYLPNWGYGRTGTLVLTSQAPPAFQARGAVDFGIAKYEKLVGALDSGGKHIFAHRIALRSSPALEFTFSEVSIVSDRAASVPHNYLPLWPVYLSQHLKLGGVTNDDINANMAMGGKWESPWGVFYGDLFVDDMPQSPSHRDAYLIAVQLGYLTPIELGGRPATFGIEYTRANNWMYTFRHLPYSYTHHGYVLGHWIGPDSDLLDVTIALPFNAGGRRRGGWQDAVPQAIEVSYQRLRHGEGKMGDVWEDFATEYARQHDFLTGVVETTHFVGAKAGWTVSENLSIAASGRIGVALNFGNAPGERAVVSYVATELNWGW